MPQKEWTTVVAGHEVRVVNSWTGGICLYIDSECRDRDTRPFTPRWRNSLSTRLVPSDASSDLIEVRVVALLNVKAQILVNGELVAGDLL